MNLRYTINMNKTGKNILIGSFAFAAIYGVYKIFFRKKSYDSNLENQELGNTTKKIGKLLISIPKSKKESYPLIYVFGGIDFATPEWMLQQVPIEILSKAIVVFAPYTSSFESVKSEALKYLSDNNYNISSSSLIGYSAGGTNVQKSYSNNFKFVGLIDPSTNERYLSLPFNSKTKMVYNDSNWGGYPAIKSALPKLDSKIESSGGVAEKVKLRHSEIPKYFFDKFKNEIV